MAAKCTFDVTTGVDLQEVDNAINQTLKEIAQRFDFKGSRCTIDFDRAKGQVKLEADDAFRMKALADVLDSKMVRRGVPIKNLKAKEDEAASLGRIRREITLTQGIPQDTAKTIVKALKAEKPFSKVQAAIQGDQLRISGASRDLLQDVIAFLKNKDFGVELTFGNYR